MSKLKVWTSDREATAVWVAMGIPAPKGLTQSVYQFATLEKQAHNFASVDEAIEVMMSWGRSIYGAGNATRGRIDGVLYEAKTGKVIPDEDVL